MRRRDFLKLGLAAIPFAVEAHSSPISWIVETLSEASSRVCGEQDAAIRGTMKRLKGVKFPTSGKALVVNIPSGVVTAYTNGMPVIESRAVVGMDMTPTPEMQTRVSYIRPNPTWTVPESIIRRKNWREKLATDPSFFEENGFDIVVRGQSMSPWDASNHASSATAFVQRPSPYNALGLLKIGLHNGDGIYLHDTNEPSRYEADVRAGSAGCVRIEHVRDVAAWALNKTREEIDGLIDGGDLTNYTPTERVSVILGYWTAWPDADGIIRYYPDIYGWDGDGSNCAGVIMREPDDDYPQSLSPNGRLIWREY